MATYGTLLTNVGQELIARYLQAGGKLDITEFAVGDGGGAEYKPTQDMTALRGEKWRGSISVISISESSPNVIIIEAMVPAEVGGFTIREAGVFDARGNLIGIMNTPQTEKVASGEGALTEQYIEMYLAVSSTAVFDLTVDPALAASKEELRQHNEDAYAHLGMLAKIDGKADAADVPTLVELDGKMEEHNKDGQAHGDIRSALAGKADGAALTAHNTAGDAHQDIRSALTEKASILLTNDAGGVTPAPNRHIWVRTEVADLQGDRSAERLELDQRLRTVEGLFQSGTWTPELVDGDGNSDATYTGQYGKWYKIGKFTHIEARLQTSDMGSLTGVITIPLPAELYKDSTNFPTYPTNSARFIYIAPPSGYTVIGPCIEMTNAYSLTPRFYVVNTAGLTNFSSLTAEQLNTTVNVSQIYFSYDYMGV